MAEQVTVARPYAKAAFQYALENGLLKQWGEMLATAVAVVENPAMKRLAGSPLVSGKQLIDLFSEIGGAQMDQASRNFISQLVDNKRLSVLPMVSDLFAQHVADHENRRNVIVKSAYELSNTEKEKLAQALKNKLGKDIRIETAVDSTLIGGVVIQAGDLVIDNSIKGKIGKLSKALNS